MFHMEGVLGLYSKFPLKSIPSNIKPTTNNRSQQGGGEGTTREAGGVWGNKLRAG